MESKDQMTIYKVWIQVERISDNGEQFDNITEPDILGGGEFRRKADALEFADQVMDLSKVVAKNFKSFDPEI